MWSPRETCANRWASSPRGCGAAARTKRPSAVNTNLAAALLFTSRLVPSSHSSPIGQKRGTEYAPPILRFAKGKWEPGSLLPLPAPERSLALSLCLVHLFFCIIFFALSEFVAVLLCFPDPIWIEFSFFYVVAVGRSALMEKMMSFLLFCFDPFEG